DTQIARRGLPQNRPRRQDSVPLGRLHHLGRGLQLDRPGEVEALTLQKQRLPERRLKIDVELLLVETLGRRDNSHLDLRLWSSAVRCVSALSRSTSERSALTDGPRSQPCDGDSVLPHPCVMPSRIRY